MTTDLRARATSTTRKLRFYWCPRCKRRAKRVGKAPKPCCGVRMKFIGSVNETIANTARGDGDG